MGALEKTGIALEHHVIKGITEEARARGVSRSQLIATILALVLPQLRGKATFSIEVHDKSCSGWHSTTNLAEENKRHLDACMTGLDFLVNVIDTLNSCPSTEGADRKLAALLKQVDSMLRLLSSIAGNKLTHAQDREWVRNFLQANPFLLERAYELLRRADDGRRQG